MEKSNYACLFIPALFNGVVNSSECTGSNDRTINEKLTGQDVEGRGRSLI
jgi:hypothetical protein